MGVYWPITKTIFDKVIIFFVKAGVWARRGPAVLSQVNFLPLISNLEPVIAKERRDSEARYSQSPEAAAVFAVETRH